jgi:circadian clock protein KaiC
VTVSDERGVPNAAEKISSSIGGLDQILAGGFPANRSHLVEGDPGTGKTTLALQFLLEGTRRGDRVLYVTLSETGEELRPVATSHGWSLDGIAIYELVPSEDRLKPNQQYTILHPSKVELGETTEAVLAEVERTRPTRVVFDSLSELRLLARDPLLYRRQILHRHRAQRRRPILSRVAPGRRWPPRPSSARAARVARPARRPLPDRPRLPSGRTPPCSAG